MCLIMVLGFSVLSHSSKDKLPECPALFHAVSKMDIEEIQFLLDRNVDTNPSLEGCDLNSLYTAYQGFLTYEDIDYSTISLFQIAKRLDSRIYELLTDHAEQVD